MTTQPAQSFSTDPQYSWSKKHPSLRKWRIESFKSVKNAAEINLAPLTVVVGANSAGKSSLIQSILLMAQNSASGLRNNAPQNQGQFELNSFLVQLGSVHETTCDLGVRDKFDSFKLGGLWYMGERDVPYFQRRPGEIRRLREGQSFIAEGSSELFLDWDLELVSFGNDPATGIASVNNSRATVVQDGIPRQTVTTKSKKVSPNLEVLRSKFERFSFAHKANFGPDDQLKSLTLLDESQQEDMRYKEKLDVVSFQSGLPTSGLREVNVIEYIFSHQRSLFLAGDLKDFVSAKEIAGAELKESIVFDNLQEAAVAFTQEVFNVARAILQQDKVADDLNLSSVTQGVETKLLIPLFQIPFSFVISSAPPTLFDNFQLEIDNFLKLVRTTLMDIYSQSDWINEKILCSLDGRRMRQPVYGQSKTSRLIEYWNRFLAESVVYLGPLRAGPRSTYGLGTGSENANIPLGESGEFLAKKLFNEKVLKRYPILENGKLRPKRITLEEAVSFWYRELSSNQSGNRQREILAELERRGITSINRIPRGADKELVDEARSLALSMPPDQDKIAVQAPGRQGYLLNIGDRTLANVGFGVSQILPVLALCLNTGPGSVILLEQPELHLNPGMQQKLADFLLHMAKTGRQIIVETHSEYLITRLRRNAATDPEDHRYFGIIFAERDFEQGTSYRAVNVDDQGDLSEWPKGFFDHVAEDLRILMRKAAERQEKKHLTPVNTEITKEE